MTGDTYDAAREDAPMRAYMTAAGLGPVHETDPAETTGPSSAPAAGDGELDPADEARLRAYTARYFPAG